MRTFAALLLSCLAAVCAQTGVTSPGTVSTTGQVTGTPVPIILNGTNQVPPNNSTASGIVTLYQNNSQLCYNMTLTGLMNVQASHIHSGGVKENGPIIYTLFSNANMTAAQLASPTQGGCINADSKQLATIGKNATGYYVNVHTMKFPDGEIRGQVQKLFVNSTSSTPVDNSVSGTDTGLSTGVVTRRNRKASSTLKRLLGN